MSILRSTCSVTCILKAAWRRVYFHTEFSKLKRQLLPWICQPNVQRNYWNSANILCHTQKYELIFRRKKNRKNFKNHCLLEFLQCILLCENRTLLSIASFHWWIQGRKGCAPPLPAKITSHFHAFFGKNLPNNRLMPPLGSPGSATTIVFAPSCMVRDPTPWQ